MIGVYGMVYVVLYVFFCIYIYNNKHTKRVYIILHFEKCKLSIEEKESLRSDGPSAQVAVVTLLDRLDSIHCVYENFQTL